MTDPLEVADAIYAVQRAMEDWQVAALAAVSACREEHGATSEAVDRSGRAAMETRIRAENLAQEVDSAQSSVEGARHGLTAADNTVDASARRHQALVAHVANTRAAWSGHLGRAQHDHQVALAQRDAAWQAERFAFDRLQAARAQAEGAGSGRYRAAALAELRDAEFGYEIAVSQRQQAAMWEVEQRARVARCGRALALAQQAAELLEAGASDLGAASQAVAHGQARLSAAQGATNTARAHLTNMEQHAEEAVIHANRAEGHLISATQHLKASEDWLGQGYVLANDAAGDMSEQIKQLQLADRPMGGGSGGVAIDATRRADSSGSSRALARNLEKSGVLRPPDSAAHHIVAITARAAAAARRVLRQHDIDVNDAVNGLFLPRNLSVPNPTGARVHSTVHTNDYYASVNDLLLAAKSHEDVLEVLSYSRDQLMHGELP